MCPVSVPISRVESVTDVLHGIPVADPYRWLEEQNSPETRAWIEEQTRYARAYLDAIPGREKIRERVRELLDVETYDSFVTNGNRYFFRKRMPGQEQPSIYFREGPDTKDQLLVDPARRGTGSFTAVKPLRVSEDGNLLLYEVKQGGERMGTFEIFDVASHTNLPDSLPHGYLRGFAFAPDSKSFYFVHEGVGKDSRPGRCVHHHLLGNDFKKDRELFNAGEDDKIRLTLVSGEGRLGALVFRYKRQTQTDFHLLDLGGTYKPICVLNGAKFRFSPRFRGARIFAAINLDSPHRRIVEIQPRRNKTPLFFDLVPEKDVPIRSWTITKNYIVVAYTSPGRGPTIEIFTFFGEYVGQLPCTADETLRVVGSNTASDEFLIESESFGRPVAVERCSLDSLVRTLWISRTVPFDSTAYRHIETCFPSNDGTSIPMVLFGREDVIEKGCHPTIMTSYGGFGLSMTPQFSTLVTFMVEHGALFALPSIRGGSELGTQWHNAAKRRNRQTAFDDFLAAADWLIKTGRTTPDRLAIFGGSNSGLLVAAAMTQRPEVFRAVLCLAPMLDMLRYHRFDNADIWKEEFGTASNPNDFNALLHYSPYHVVRAGTSYPAVMLISGDVDQNCNPLHARKMTARLQAANTSPFPIFLDYDRYRGHSPVLPLTKRAEALTDRLAFLCDQLRMPYEISSFHTRI